MSKRIDVEIGRAIACEDCRRTTSGSCAKHATRLLVAIPKRITLNLNVRTFT